MTPLHPKLQEIAERVKAASLGPFDVGTFCEKGIVSYFIFSKLHGRKLARIFSTGDKEEEENDANFFAHSITDIELLLKALELAIEHLVLIDLLKEGFEEDYIKRASKLSWHGIKNIEKLFGEVK